MVLAEAASIPVSSCSLRPLLAVWAVRIRVFSGQNSCGSTPGSGRQDGTSAVAAMATALVSVFTGRPVRGDLAMTEEITLSGEVLAVGGVKEKVLAAHRCGLTRVILPQQNRKQVEEDLGDDLRSAVAIDYVTRIEDLLELALRPAPAANDVAAAVTTDGRVS